MERKKTGSSDSAGASDTPRTKDISDYRTVGEWYADYRGRVPIQMAAGLDRLMQSEGISFHEAYRRLVERGRIIETPQEPPATQKKDGS